MTTSTEPPVQRLAGVGETARWMAAARERESLRDDRLFVDPYAAALAGPDGYRLLTHFHPRYANDNGNPYLAIRTRWFDEWLASTVPAGTQVVGLAAGLDTRSLRLPWAEDVTVFEVDQPDVLAYKREKLGERGNRVSCARRVTVEIDLSEDWPAALARAGFDESRPTVWFAEGLLFYLPEELSAEVLRTAAGLSAPGSHIAVDLIGTGIFRFPYMQEFLRRLADADAPWVSGTDDPAGFVAAAGWSNVEVTEPGLDGASYGRWPRQASSPAFRNLPRIYLVSAERPG